MKVRILGALFLCVIVLVAAVACTGSGKAPNGMTGKDILTRSQNASASINTSQFDVTMEASVMGEAMTVTMSGAVDVPSRNMYISETMSMLNSTGTVELYTVDSWIYAYSATLKGEWVKTPVTETSWNKEYSESMLSEFWNGSVDAKYIGMENVGGRSCYKIAVQPNLDAVLGTLNMSELGNVSLSDVMKSYSCLVWIDENTYYPVEVSFDMTLEVDKVTMSVSGIGVSKFNQPITVVLPAAAQNATSISYEDLVSGNW